MKRIFIWIILLLTIAPLAPESVFAVPAQITVGDRTGGVAPDLDAIECEDILCNDSDRAIATGDRAISWASDGLICFYVYNSTGTASESDPSIIVPDDRADCSNQGQWEAQLCGDYDDLYDLVAGISGLVKGGGAGSGYSAAVDGTDFVKTKFAANTDLNEKTLYEDYYPCDDACVSTNDVDLSGKGIHVKFDDSGTDEDEIDSFSNQQAGAWYHFAFIDEYWTIDFTTANLFGHNGLKWEPSAGDSMLCYSVDGTNMYCQVSRPTALAVNLYYDMPLDSTPANNAWHGPTAEYENGSGSALSQWDLVYLRPDGASQEGALWPWDGDLAIYKYYKPIGVVVESGGIADGNTGTVGIIGGIGRNDSWTFITDNTDEGKTIYGSNTAGDLTDVAPSTQGNIACAVGIAQDDKVIEFNFGLCTTTEVGS